MNKLIHCTCLALILAVSIPATADIPRPEEQVVEVVTYANVSTLRKLDVYHADQEIPHTYATHKIDNVTGFSWYVSKHFALHTDHDDEMARKALQVLEMAYPHWVEYMNDEPEDMHDTRIPVVHASDWELIKQTTAEYGFMKSPVINGEMMYYNSVAYSHDKRPLYLLLHEGFHSFADVFRHGLKAGWFTEGAAQDSAHYIINDDWDQMAIFVWDRGHYNKWKYSLDNWKKEPPKVDGFTKWGPPYNAGATIQHFFKDDPLRNQFWKIWSKYLSTEFYKLNANQEDGDKYSDKLLYSLFGSKENFKETWETWLKETEIPIQATGWWQGFGNKLKLNRDSSGYVIYPFPLDQKAVFNPLVMDFFPPAPSELVGKVKRGGDNPSVGVLIENVATGKSGLAFAFVGKRPLLRVVVENANTLVIHQLKGGDETVERHALPEAMIEHLQSENNSVGLNIALVKNGIEVTVKTLNSSLDKSFELDEESLKAVREKHIAIISEGSSRALLTPYFDDGRPALSAYENGGLMNRWFNEGDSAFGRIVEANWLMKDKAPEYTRELQSSMHKAATQADKQQKKALKNFNKSMSRSVKAISKLELINQNQVLTALSGLRLKTSWDSYPDKDSSTDTVTIFATIENPSNEKVSGKLSLLADNTEAVTNAYAVKSFSIEANSTTRISHTFKRTEGTKKPFNINVNAVTDWLGESIQLTDRIRDERWPGMTMNVSPELTALGEDTALLDVELYADDNFPVFGEITFEASPADAVENPLVEIDIHVLTAQKRNFSALFKRKGNSPFTVKVTGNLRIDTEPYRFIQTAKAK